MLKHLLCMHTKNNCFFLTMKDRYEIPQDVTTTALNYDVFKDIINLYYH